MLPLCHSYTLPFNTFYIMNKSISLEKSKPHYEILDGLRGVAAILVVLFHVLEVYSHGDFSKQIINHGYLAVDFFFLLSGFVLGYAYDDRWDVMTLKDFFKRRVVRLQPMIVVGTLIGAALFYFQISPQLGWGSIGDTPIWKFLLVIVIGVTLFPVGKSLDIRGWTEMHPLNGAAWSLFFEYIANIVYALVLRRLSKAMLTLLVLIAAGVTIFYALSNEKGNMIGGWSISDLEQLKIGFIRLAFPFLAGLLMARVAKIKFIKYAFLIASLALIVLMAMPYLGGENGIINRWYEIFCLIIAFPIIIWIGAGGAVKGAKSNKVCKFLGDISYPIYITHYPFIYLYMAWVVNNNLSLEDSWYYGLGLVVVIILVAYISMRFYDLPVRAWLRKKFL